MYKHSVGYNCTGWNVINCLKLIFIKFCFGMCFAIAQYLPTKLHVFYFEQLKPAVILVSCPKNGQLLEKEVLYFAAM